MLSVAPKLGTTVANLRRRAKRRLQTIGCQLELAIHLDNVAGEKTGAV